MLVFHLRLSAIIVLLMLCNQPLAFARSGQVSHDDPWNSERIDQLPPEVRSAVMRLCGHPPRAAHYFATYIDSSRVIKLHFEHLQCDDQKTYCSGDGCLRQEYVYTGGRYRLLRSYYGRNNN